MKYFDVLIEILIFPSSGRADLAAKEREREDRVRRLKEMQEEDRRKKLEELKHHVSHINRVEHSHWSRSVQILCSDWLNFTMLVPRSMP